MPEIGIFDYTCILFLKYILYFEVQLYILEYNITYIVISILDTVLNTTIHINKSFFQYCKIVVCTNC